MMDEKTKTTVYKYLTRLRDSGKMNMWGASDTLMKTFGLGRDDAKDILIAWMQYCKGEVQNEN